MGPKHDSPDRLHDEEHLEDVCTRLEELEEEEILELGWQEPVGDLEEGLVLYRNSAEVSTLVFWVVFVQLDSDFLV